jgi:excisionase family DNA binding protein
MSEKPLTPREVARRKRVSVETIRRMLRSGEIPAEKFGRQWRINPTDVGLALSSASHRNAQDAT